MLGKESKTAAESAFYCAKMSEVRVQDCAVAAAAAKSLQSCLTLCDPIDGSPPGSPILGILQARTLEWVAISFSKDCVSSWKLSGGSGGRGRGS